MLAVSLLSLGWRAGIVVAITIPLVLAATFLVMFIIGIDLQRISLGALIIALGLLVDDAMIAVEMMERKLDEGFGKLSAASFAYTLHGLSDADRHAHYGGRLHPRRLRRQYVGRICEHAVLGCRHLACDLLVRGGHFTPWLGYTILKHRPHAGRRLIAMFTIRRLSQASRRYRLVR